jgi:hypothetical protein
MKMSALQPSRNLAGVLIKDWPRYRRALRARDSVYLGICNRNERLELAPDGQGYRCDWQWTSDLHAPKYLAVLGRRLMKRALADHPVRGVHSPEKPTDPPDVSFVIGHRGQQRLPHLLLTLQSIAAQRDVSFECIVVEQSAAPEVKELLPSWVRYIYTPLPYADMPYCRAWAFNTGARGARSGALVLHDNDILVPVDYAKAVVERFRDGYQVMNLKRFIFYLNQADSNRAVFSGAFTAEATPLAIMQNALGGTIAASREAYFSIGGFDESFVGWGGEDNEFWDRAQTLKVWPFGYLPMLHLWHAPQGEKHNGARETASLYEERSAIPVRDRIVELTARDFGNVTAPSICSLSRRT